MVLGLLKKSVEIIKTSGASLEHVPEFTNSPNEWTSALLKTYENFYKSDCLKLKKTNNALS